MEVLCIYADVNKRKNRCSGDKDAPPSLFRGRFLPLEIGLVIKNIICITTSKTSIVIAWILVFNRLALTTDGKNRMCSYFPMNRYSV